MKRLHLLTFASFLCQSTVAFAGGYQLTEYTAVGLGRSFAGAGVTGDDFSAIAMNPAGMTLKQSGGQFGANLVMLKGRAEGTYTDSHGFPVQNSSTNSHAGKIDVKAGLPHMFAQYAYEDWRFGIGFYVPFGLSAKYTTDDWFGSDISVNSKITVYDIAPTIAYKIGDTLSIGVSLLMEKCTARMTNSLKYANGGSSEGGSSMNADATMNFGYNIGIMVAPSENLRLGVSYRTKTEHNIDGPHDVVAGGAERHGIVGTTLQFPEHVLLSASYDMNAKWTLGTMAKWTRWSRFDVLKLSSTVSSASIDEKWKNVWQISVGADYRHNEKWTFRFGLGYDESGIPDAAHRTARVPDADRIMLSGGVSYIQPKYQIDFGYMHMFFKTARSEAQGMDAKYTVQTDVLSLQAQYFF